MKKNKITIMAFLSVSSLYFAQEKKLLTLDEAVQLGIQNSKNLKIDEAKIQEATANYIEAKNRQLPDFKLSGTALALANANVEDRKSVV